MGGWYIVIKTIKGHRYRYRQRTWREGTHVRTESYSLGPASEATKEGAETKLAPQARAKTLVKAHLTPVFVALCDQRAAAPQWLTPWNPSASSPGTFKHVQEIDELVKASGARVGRSWDAAHYRTRSDLIELPEPRSFAEREGLSATEGYYHTLLHELAHWTGHSSRLNRFSRSGDLRELKNYAREELVAEATAVIVMSALGKRPASLATSTAYFRLWLNRAGDVEEALNHAMFEAEQAAELIFRFSVNTTKQI